MQSSRDVLCIDCTLLTAHCFSCSSLAWALTKKNNLKCNNRSPFILFTFFFESFRDALPSCCHSDIPSLCRSISEPVWCWWQLWPPSLTVSTTSCPPVWWGLDWRMHSWWDCVSVVCELSCTIQGPCRWFYMFYMKIMHILHYGQTFPKILDLFTSASFCL